jgi:rhamnosyltransferase
VIGAVIILYFPDKQSLRRNILSFVSGIDKLLVINNSPDDEVKAIINSIAENIEYIENENNMGIAQPLNYAAKWAIEQGLSMLLTMDQDSYFEGHNFEKYLLWLEENFNDRLAVVGINYGYEPLPTNTDLVKVENVNKVITSGSVINLKAWQSIKGFEESLFIDEVDHEYCYRAIDHGFLILKLNSIYLSHSMGKLVASGYLNVVKVKNRMVHSPLRVYYIVRNYLFVRLLYKNHFKKEFRQRDKEIMVILKNNLFFSGSFWSTFQMAWKGYRDFKHQKMGKFAGNLS